MNHDQISRTWRDPLAESLRERYGLTAEEANRKTDAWLNQLAENPDESWETAKGMTGYGHVMLPPTV